MIICNSRSGSKLFAIGLAFLPKYLLYFFCTCSISGSVLQMYYHWSSALVISPVIYQILPNRFTVSIRSSRKILCFNEHNRLWGSFSIPCEYFCLIYSTAKETRKFVTLKLIKNKIC